MGFAHQGHNIPWQVLREVLVEKTEYARFLGGGKLGTRLAVREDWPQDRVVKAVRHFARRFAWAVEEFGRTELLKFRPARSTTELLYDERHFDDVLVPGQFQQVSFWEKSKESGFVDYSLVDVVIRLLERGMFDSLLLLVDAGIRLDKLAYGIYCNSHDYRFGISAVVGLYMVLNLGVIMDSFKVGAPFNTWLTLMSYDRGRSIGPHGAFLRRLESDTSPDFVHSQLSGLFRFIYQYHAIMVECGRHENWEYEALGSFPPFHLRHLVFEYARILRVP